MLGKLAFAALIALTLLLPIPAVAQESSNQSDSAPDVESDVRALAKDLATAIVKRDTRMMERLLMKDFVDINPDGTVSSRMQFIGEYNHPPTTANTFEAAEFVTNGSNVRFYGDVAVLTGPTIWRGRTAEGQAFAGTLVTTMVAAKSNGNWLIATTHSSAVSPPNAKTEPEL